MRGELALAGVDLSTRLDVWLDAAYAAWVRAPFEVLDKVSAVMARQVARIDPEEARKTWGLRPEHRALAGNLETGGAPPPGRQPSALERARGGFGMRGG